VTSDGASDTAEYTDAARLRLLLVSHDNRVIGDSAAPQRVSEADAADYASVFAASQLQEDATQEQEAREGMYQTTVYATSLKKVRLRTSSASASTSGAAKYETVIRLRNAFVGNGCGAVDEEKGEEKAGGGERGPDETRMCMIVPEIIVRLDAQTHFGTVRHGSGLGTKRSRATANLDAAR
jgi:hypothetical protein